MWIHIEQMSHWIALWLAATWRLQIPQAGATIREWRERGNGGCKKWKTAKKASVKNTQNTKTLKGLMNEQWHGQYKCHTKLGTLHWTENDTENNVKMTYMMNPKWLHTPKMQINRILSSNNQNIAKIRLGKISPKTKMKQHQHSHGRVTNYIKTWLMGKSSIKNSK